MSIRNRVAVLETRKSDRPRRYIIHRTIVSPGKDGKLNERLATIRGLGKLIHRGINETREAFVARAKEELKEQNQ